MDERKMLVLPHAVLQRRGANQYLRPGPRPKPVADDLLRAEITKAVARVARTDETTEEDYVAAVFAPDSDQAWRWAFPLDATRELWRMANPGLGAVNAREWSEQGITPSDVRRWAAAGFTAVDASRWNSALAQHFVVVPIEYAEAWKDYGFTVEGVHELGWLGSEPTEAFRPWEQRGFTAADVLAWSKLGVTSPAEARAITDDSTSVNPSLDRQSEKPAAADDVE